MKIKYFLLSVVFSISSIVYGQVNDSLTNKIKHEASADLCAFYTSVLSNDLYGFNFDFKYYPIKRFATGFNASMTQKKISNTFSYSIGQSLIDYYEFGWINQYDFLQSYRIRMGINLNNGIAISRLGDNEIKEKYRSKYGYQYKAKEIATDYFYLLEPGLDFSIRLFSKNHYPDFYLTTKAKYRFVFGDSKYGSLNQFSNFYLGLGLSIIGFTD
jgi:hypothetical protein